MMEVGDKQIKPKPEGADSIESLSRHDNVHLSLTY